MAIEKIKRHKSPGIDQIPAELIKEGSRTIRCEILNLLKPNVNYSGRTAPLNSKVAFYIFIQQIFVPNILNMVYTLRFFLFKMQFVS